MRMTWPSSRIERFVLPGLAILLLAQCGSDERARVAREGERLATEWRGAASAPPAEAAAPAGLQRLFVDASQSMRGFGACARGVRSVEELTRWLPTALGVDSASVFGQPRPGRAPAIESQRFRRDLFCEGYFGALNNPDYELYRRLTADSTTISLYLTDGVQSDEQGGTIVRTVDLLARHLAAGRALGFVVFRMPFSGQLWSERLNTMVEGRAVVSTTARPLYLVVLAPTSASLRSLLGRLALPTRQGWAATWVLSREELLCATNVPAISGAPKLKRDIGWLMIDASKLPTGPNDALLTLSCDVPQGFPVSRMAADVPLAVWAWGPSGFKPVETTGALQAGATSGTDGSSLSLKFLFKPPRELPCCRYMHLGVEFRPRVARLAPLLDSLSTPDDGTPDAVGRTYRLAELVQRLATELLDSIPAGRRRGSVTIGYQ